jgi:hypothetical protein
MREIRSFSTSAHRGQFLTGNRLFARPHLLNTAQVLLILRVIGGNLAARSCLRQTPRRSWNICNPQPASANWSATPRTQSVKPTISWIKTTAVACHCHDESAEWRPGCRGPIPASGDLPRYGCLPVSGLPGLRLQLRLQLPRAVLLRLFLALLFLLPWRLDRRRLWQTWRWWASLSASSRSPNRMAS